MYFFAPALNLPVDRTYFQPHYQIILPTLEEKNADEMCNLPVSVYKSVESKSISPAGGEILNVDLRISDINRQNTIRMQE